MEKPTTIIHIRDAPKGWRLDPEYVYIGRPTYLSNPFVIGIHGNRKQVISQYRKHLNKLRADDPEMFDAYMDKCVRGSTLVCFCKPLPCHGDVILEFVNHKEEIV